MLHVDKVSLMPFLEILTVIAVARNIDLIFTIHLWGVNSISFAPNDI